MNHKIRNILFGLGIVLYLVIGFYEVNRLSKQMAEDYYTLLGSKASDLAKIASESLYITDKDVAELKTLSYEEMLDHPVNNQLESIFSSDNFSKELNCSYIEIILDDSEVKYWVTEETKDFYGAPVGSPLNLMWLIDVDINGKPIDSENPYKDIYRYSFAKETDRQALLGRSSSYYFSESEYGKDIVGTAPIYTSEQTYVGLLCVDIFYDNYTDIVFKNRNGFALVFLFPTIVLTVIYILIYFIKSRESNLSANTDELSSLYNRRYLNYILPRLITEAYYKELSLSSIMIDIDFFKLYNDHYGHKKGDEVITAISSAIVSVLRKNTDIVCRYGGEEIIVLLPHTDLLGATQVASKIKLAIDKLAIAHEYSHVSSIVTVSQGVYSAVPSSDTKEVVNDYIVNADKALYRAKGNGRDRFEIFFSE